MEKEKVETKESIKEEKSAVELRLKRKDFNVLDSALACSAFIVLQLLATIVVDFLPETIKQSFTVAFLLSVLVEAVFVFAVLIVASKRSVEFVNATTIKKKPDFLSVLIAVAISVICLFSFTGLTNTFVNVLYKLGYSSSASLTVPNFFVYLIYVFLLCIVPAFCEDLLFRGCILSGLRKLGDHKAVIISAVIFMLMHGGPDQTVHQLIIGVVLGYAFIASGTIWVPVIVHFFNNFIALTAAYITRNVEVVETVVPTWGQIFLQFASAIVTAIIGVYLVYFCLEALKKIRKKKETDKEQIEINKESEEANEVGEQLVEKVQESPENLNQKEKKLTKLYFILSGIYLVLNWVLAFVGGLL